MATADHAVACYSCGARQVSVFYESPDVPVQSCVLVESVDAANSYPVGSLRLGFCLECGFIQNLAFDPPLVDYSRAAEDTQGFSATFSAFARGVAQSLIDRNDLYGKQILEIGCGKGEFLRLLAELGGNSGVGIDPGYVHGRLTCDAARRIRFIPEYFSEAHLEMPADFVCCRHVLEHVQPVREFMRLIRKAAGRSRDPVVFFEVPDVRRILTEGAFWDIYHEHCSYFSPGSIGRLCRSLDFTVLGMTLAYDEQYILLESRASDGKNAARAWPARAMVGCSVEEESVEELWRDVRLFAAAAAEKRNYWLDALAGARRRGRTIALWGGGSKAVAFLTTLAAGDSVDCVVDVNPFKQGHYLPGSGHEVVGPESLLERRPDLVIVMNRVYQAEIGEWVRAHGLAAKVVAL